MREVKVAEFINLKQGNMSVEEYSLKFSMLSKYATSLVSNSRDEISCFMSKFAYSVREECRTTMLHNDMIVATLIMYAQSIKESKHKRMARNLKRCGYSDQDQPRFKKRAQTQEDPRSAKVKFERGGGSRNKKPIEITC